MPTTKAAVTDIPEINVATQQHTRPAMHKREYGERPAGARAHGR